jgi:hypothetical protein
MRQAGLYLNCPRCGLSIEIRSHWLAVTHCPRCIARSRTAVELFSSEMPASLLHANGSLPCSDTITAPREHVPAGQPAQGDGDRLVVMAAATGTSPLVGQRR